MAPAVVIGMKTQAGGSRPAVVLGYEVMRPASLKLKYVPVLPMMRWSRIWMSRSFDALMRVVVTCLSALLGLVLPDGWLCASMRA